MRLVVARCGWGRRLMPPRIGPASIRAAVSRRYGRLLEAQARTECFPGPPPNLRWYNSFTSYFRSEAVYRMCQSQGGKRILLIGDGGGRDYWYLRWKGNFELSVVDIAPQSAVPDLIEGDVAEPLPFHPGAFDCVVACDILEHVYDDRTALANIWRVLRPDGVLIISGPYWHDADRTHVRLHSPAIIRRTLGDTGFTVEEQIARGGLAQLYMRGLHALNVGFNLAWFTWTGRTMFGRLNDRLFAVNLRVTRWRRLPYLERALFGMTGGLNGYVIQARKNLNPPVNVQALSREKFADMSPEPLAARATRAPDPR